MQRREAWHDSSGERPILWMFCQFRDARIVNDVEANSSKGILLSLIPFEDMIVRLVLKFVRSERRFQMCSQKSHAVTLVGIRTQTHPDQMQMIRHEAIGRAKQSFARCDMQQQLAKCRVKLAV